MKRFFVFVTALFFFFFGFVLDSHAGSERALIKVLVKKGILTTEEAKQIIEEVKKEQEKERLKVKEVTVKEVKREIKEDKELKDSLIPATFKGIKFGMLSYIDFSAGKSPLSNNDEFSYNKFKLTRGYLTLKKEFLPWLHARLTYDIHRENTGDYKGRIKYLYAEIRPNDLLFLTDMKMEIGQGHIPWLDFEEHVNPYRMQGTMPIERAGVFNSADVGVSIRGYLGGKLDNAKLLTGNTHYAGRYGSWHIGVYNGAGYHEDEKNNNKVIEGRITLRPMPDIIPGLQLSYLGIYGEGNRKAINGDYPDYRVNQFMLSYEHPSLIFTGQFFKTKGNSKGNWVDANGDALRTECYALFLDYRLPITLFSQKRLHIFGRYDHFDQDENDHIASDTAYDMYMFGFAWDIYKGNKFILDFEKTDYEDNAGKKGKVPQVGNNLGDEYKVQAVLQVKF